MPTPRGPRRARWLAGIAVVFACLGAAAQPHATPPAAPGAPAPAATGPALSLSDGQPMMRAEGLAAAWLDETGSAGIEDVVQHPARFTPAGTDTVFPLAEGKALWMRLRLVRTEGSHQQWLLAFTNPLIDLVDMWQQDEHGHWRQQSAGDLVAVDAWPEPGRYPVFRLELPSGQPRDVYMRARYATPTSVPVRLSTDAAHTQLLQFEYLGLGAAFGAMLLLIAACLAQSWAYRDRAYSWYAVYTTFTMLCLMAYTGTAAHLLWPRAPAWADAAPGVLAFLSGGTAILFVHRLTGVAARSPLLGRFGYVAGCAGLPLATSYLLAPRPIALDLLSGYLAVVLSLNVTVAWLAWRRRDVVGFWVVMAYLPLTLAVLLAVVRLLGFLPISFATQYAALLAVVLEVPLLLVALSIRSRDRHGAQIREQALSSQDALTGLLAPHLFHDRLRQVVARFKRDREDAAIVFIDLVNHARIKAAFGSAVAEQSLLRSVIKLRRVVRDVDTVGRIGEARFGLILEGAASRSAVAERAARLIAAGLMPLQGLKPDVTLQFHVAAVLLRERLVEARELPLDLGELLASMSPRTRRPIRFLAPDETQPADLDPDSDIPPDALPVPAA